MSKIINKFLSFLYYYYIRKKNDILKQEDILDEILNGIDQLKHIAKNTGETLDKQNKTIEKITIKTEKNTKDMNKLNSDMKKYLK